MRTSKRKNHGKGLCKNAETRRKTRLEQLREAAGFQTKEALAAAAKCSLRTIATCEKTGELPKHQSLRESYLRALGVADLPAEGGA